MIFITGDTHGQFYRIKKFCKKHKTSKEDILIVLGDSGINYSEGLFDEKLKKKLDKIPITIFCIHGNHEQRPSEIPSYQEIKWNGGIVYIEKAHPKLIFAKDGEIYDFDGKKAVVIGGAYSVDKNIRLSRCMPWYDNEQPSDIIKKRVEETLEKCDWKIDLVLSHTVPLKYEPIEVFLPTIDQTSIDKTTEIWLDTIEGKLNYIKWYAGHYHIEKKTNNIQIMYENIEELYADKKSD